MHGSLAMCSKGVFLFKCLVLNMNKSCAGKLKRCGIGCPRQNLTKAMASDGDLNVRGTEVTSPQRPGCDWLHNGCRVFMSSLLRNANKMEAESVSQGATMGGLSLGPTSIWNCISS